VTWIWLIALTVVLVFHCLHFVRAPGQHRWLHASHILMLVSMLSRYASMEFTWTWLPASLQSWVFGLSKAAILAWIFGLINDTRGAGGVGPGDRASFVPLAHPTVFANVTMAIMAASMGYMFTAMQLMR